VLSGEVVGRRRGGGRIAVLVALACVLALPSTASAELFFVDSTGDAVDAAPGNEFCETATEGCTLRAAVEEANALAGEFDQIRFEEEVFEGQLADTIDLGSSLTITDRGLINGRACPTAAGVAGPCVGIEGPPGAPALIVDHAQGVEILGLAVTGAQAGVSIDASPLFKVRGGWFGVTLDGTVSGNGAGVLVGPGSNRSFIGGEGPGQGNVFAGNEDAGLVVHGSSEVKVFGNDFGIEPDGVTPAANGGDAVEVASFEGLEATGTEIGTRVSLAATASSQCDGGCNVISGAASNGIDLQGDGGLETPAASTVVLGNYIGLDANGAAAVPNAGTGINVGEAAQTVIGGPSGGETNRINGGSAAVLAGPAAADLAVRGNLIGTDETGDDVLAPPEDGIVVDSGELASQSLEAEIVANEIRMEEGIAILQRGQGAWILDNEIFGAETGIRTAESNAFFGNVIEGNSIEGPAANGILLENDLNEVVANQVVGAGAAGVRIEGSAPFGVSGNLIGGDAAADENVIDSSGGPAIAITNIEATDNEVARNRGVGNAGPFIDLVAASPATEVGPNRGIEPPTFSTATQAGASGGAEEGARVRVFRKQLAAAGELGSFLGEAVADSTGSWDLTYGVAIPAGAIVAATQTKDGATSELVIATTPGSEGGVGGGAGEGFGGGSPSMLESAIARIRPQTKIVRGRVRNRSVRFVFESSQAHSKFLCRLDGRPFDICRSPKRYDGLQTGRHVFWVRAIDSSGRVDLSPAKKKFVVPL
jgi:CSLREA domain-containing protein